MQPQKIITSLTPTSIFWLVLGAAIFAYGVYIAYRWRMYSYAVGLIGMGIGSIICGLTNGFTDQSPTGRIVSKFGIVALLGGVVLVGYYFLRFI